jgi:hypothetical protein
MTTRRRWEPGGSPLYSMARALGGRVTREREGERVRRIRSTKPVRGFVPATR